MSKKKTVSPSDAATFSYIIKANTGYEARATYENVTSNQYRQIVAALNGKLKEASPAQRDMEQALQKIADDVCDNEYTRIARAALAKVKAAK